MNEAFAGNINKQVHFKAGTYPISDAPLQGSSLQRLIVTSDKPQVFNAVEGATVTFDGEDEGYFDFDADCLGDLAFIGIQWTHPQTPESGGRTQNIRLSGQLAETRSLLFRNTFIGDGTETGGSNSSVIMYADAGSPTSNYGTDSAIIQNVFRDVFHQDLALYYTVQYHVAEGNRIENSYSDGQGFFVKGNSNLDMSFRFNVGIEGMVSPLVFVSEFTNHIKGNIEIKWNLGYIATMAEGVYGIYGLGQGSAGDVASYGAIVVARNNWKTPGIALQALEDGPFTFRNDAIECDAAFFAEAEPCFDVIDDDGASKTFTGLARSSSSVFDADMLMTGSFRTTNLGSKGAEFVYQFALPLFGLALRGRRRYRRKTARERLAA